MISFIQNSRKCALMTEGRSVAAWGWGYELQRSLRKLLGVLDVFNILTVVMVSWIQIYVITYHIVILNMCGFLYVN